MPRKRGVGCFGSRSNHPEIRYGIDHSGGMHVLQEFSLPMPEESELNAKFAELVVSRNKGRHSCSVSCTWNVTLFSFITFLSCDEIERRRWHSR